MPQWAYAAILMECLLNSFAFSMESIDPNEIPIGFSLLIILRMHEMYDRSAGKTKGSIVCVAWNI